MTTAEQKTITAEGRTLGEAVRNAAQTLGVTPELVLHRLDREHFLSSQGSSRGVDTVKIHAWSRDPGEMEGASAAREWLGGLLTRMGFESAIQIKLVGDKKADLAVSSPNSRHIVGRRGATLHAIQDLMEATLTEQTPGWSFRIDVLGGDRDGDGDDRRPRDDDRRPRDDDRRPRDDDRRERPRRDRDDRRPRDDDRRPRDDDRRPRDDDRRPRDDDRRDRRPRDGDDRRPRDDDRRPRGGDDRRPREGGDDRRPREGGGDDRRPREGGGDDRRPRRGRDGDDRRDRRPRDGGDDRRGGGRRRNDDDVKALEALARKLATRVLDTGETVVIRQELNSFERRIVHVTVSKMKGLSTKSIEEDGIKRVRISLDSTEE